ncbi:MAG TPA: acetyl-CoA carboxylase biotin carboxyl carrier protein [Flavobacteriales bacterium]|jgi:acetyl-CoA carboxylase biotin carboxyl carrier protein|nr:acetyl-CoA carboxylase biotin carboxyl carrier protein [Flavobacteriales bacterium]
MDIKEVQNLIKFVAKSGVSEVKIEDKDFKLTIKNKPEFIEAQTVTQVALPAAPQVTMQAPAQMTAPQIDTPAPAANEVDESKYVTIKAPIIGTFYRKPSPDKPPYVEVGDTVQEGDVVCIIEAMKLFNEIESEVSGRIVKILVEDATPVEFDQPLFLVEPL